MAYQAGTAFVQILPSLRGFSTKVTADLKRINPTAEVRMDPEINDRAAQGAATRAAKSMGRKVEFKIDVDKRSLISTTQAADSLQRGLSRIAIPAALLTAAPAVHALASSLVAAAGAALLLPAVLVAGGAAAGTFKLGLSGIGDALGALSKSDKASASSASQAASQRSAAAKQVRAAAESVKEAEKDAARTSIENNRRIDDAVQRVTDARRDAADAAEQANQRVADAEADLRAAQQRSKDAQEDLTRARKEAREELEDLSLSLRGSALDEQQAVIDLQKAQEKLQTARAAGVGGRDLKEIELDAAQAALRLDEIRERYGDLKERSAEFAATGIEGSRGVQQAQRGVADASASVQAATRAVQQAETDRAKTNAEGARAIREAQAGVREAQEAAAWAQQDASARVAMAQRDLREATADAASAGREQASAANDAALAMANLSPNAQSLVNTLRALQPAWDGLRLDVQDRLLAGVGARVQALATNYIPVLKSSLGGIADGFNRAFHVTAAWFNEPQVVRDVAAAMGLVSLGVQNASGAIQPLVRAFTDIFVVGAEFMPGLGTALANAAQRFADFIQHARETGQLRQWIADGLAALRELWEIVKGVWHAFKAFYDFFAPLLAAMAPFAPAILGMVVAVKILLGVFSTLSTIFTTVRVALAVFGGPVTIAIAAIMLLVGAVIYAWQNFEWFRNAVKVAWDAIVVASKWAWENVLKPIWDAMVWVWQNYVQPVLVWLYHEVFIPVMEGIGRIVQAIWVNVLKPVWETMVRLWQDYVQPAIIYLWQNVFDPALRAIGAIIVWAWENVIRPTFNALVWLIENILAPVIGWLWRNIVEPAFIAIAEIIKWAWLNVIEPTWSALVWVIQNILAPVFSWIWNDVVKPIWNNLGAGIKWVWENVIRPSWDALRGGLDWLGQSFDKTVNWIRDIWNKLRGFLAVPINFVIREVWNKGIRGAWNLVAGLLPGVEPVGELKEIPEYARGGKLTGGTPGKDSILLKAMPGEYILPTSMARSIGYDNLDAARQAALQGRRVSDEGMFSGVPGFAQGGRIEEAKRFAASQHGKRYQWGGVGNPSWDCSGFMSGIQNVLLGRPANRRLYTTSQFGPNRGAAGMVPFGRNGGSAFTVGVQPGHMAGTLDGVNVESSSGPGVRFGQGARGTSSFPWHFFLPQVGGQFVDPGPGGGVFDFLGDLLGKIADQFSKPMHALVDAIPFDAPPKFLGIPKKLGHHIIDKATEWFKSDANNAAPVGGGDGPISYGTGPVADQVRAVANSFGWGGGPQWDALARLIQKESGWNPRAQNPRSTAFGLFQFLDSTWAAQGGRKSDNPSYQATLGLRYIKQRYRDPIGALNFHNRNNWYDEGGWLPPGLSTVYNGTGRPEPVLTRQQLDLLARGAGGDGASGDTYIINPSTPMDEVQIARETARIQQFNRRIAV